MSNASAHGRAVLADYHASDLSTDRPSWRGKALAAGNRLAFEHVQEGDSPYLGKAHEMEGKPCKPGYSAARTGCIPKGKDGGKDKAPAKEKPVAKEKAKPTDSSSDVDKAFSAIAAQLAKEKQGGDGSILARDVMKSLREDGMSKEQVESALEQLASDGKITLARVDTESQFTAKEQADMPRIEGRLFSGISARSGEASEAMQGAIDKAKVEGPKAKEPASKPASAKEAPAKTPAAKSDDPAKMSTAELKAAKAELQGKLAAVQAELAKRTSAEKAGKPAKEKAEAKSAAVSSNGQAAVKEVASLYGRAGAASNEEIVAVPGKLKPLPIEDVRAVAKALDILTRPSASKTSIIKDIHDRIVGRQGSNSRAQLIDRPTTKRPPSKRALDEDEV